MRFFCTWEWSAQKHEIRMCVKPSFFLLRQAPKTLPYNAYYKVFTLILKRFYLCYRLSSQASLLQCSKLISVQNEEQRNELVVAKR